LHISVVCASTHTYTRAHTHAHALDSIYVRTHSAWRGIKDSKLEFGILCVCVCALKEYFTHLAVTLTFVIYTLCLHHFYNLNCKMLHPQVFRCKKCVNKCLNCKCKILHLRVYFFLFCSVAPNTSSTAGRTSTMICFTSLAVQFHTCSLTTTTTTHRPSFFFYIIFVPSSVKFTLKYV